MKTWINTYEIFGIPSALAVTFVMFVFGLCLIPYFKGQKLFGAEIPVLGKKTYKFFQYVGPIFLIASLSGFYPHWPNLEVIFANSPRCLIQANPTSGSKYRLSWFIDSPYPADARVNNAPVDLKDSAEYDFRGSSTSERYVITASNRWGQCVKQVTVTPSYILNRREILCEITSNRTKVSLGEPYTISWNVISPSANQVEINGREVAAFGRATFNFVGPNTDAFTLLASGLSSPGCEVSVSVGSSKP